LGNRFVILAIFVVQILCAAFFVSNILFSILGIPFIISWRLIEVIELGAALGLLTGVVFGAMVLRRALRRSAAAEAQLRIASGAFMELIEERFQEWALTPAERDVALFAIKGLTIQEIASARNTSEGTVKAQTNAIYRKAGVSSRAQLVSLFIDDLIDESLMAAQ